MRHNITKMNSVLALFALLVSLVPLSASAALSVDIRANDQDGTATVATGQHVLLKWTSTDAKSCVVSGSRENPYRTRRSWTLWIRHLQNDETWTIECIGTSGQTATDSVTIRVTDAASTGGTGSPTATPVPPPPASGVRLDLTASPSYIVSGGNSVLRWESQGFSGCVASGGWSGTKAILGSETVFPGTTTTYTLRCENGSINMQRSATITVAGTTPAPTPSSALTLSHRVKNIAKNEAAYAPSAEAQGLDNLEYEIVVENKGAAALSPVSVRVELPAQDLYFVPASTVIGGTPAADGVASPSGIVLGSLAAGSRTVITYRAVVYYNIAASKIDVPAVVLVSGTESARQAASVTIVNRGQVLGAATTATGPANIGLIAALSGFVLALGIYMIFFVLRLHERRSLQHAGVHTRLRMKIWAARIKERYPDA